MDKNIPENIKRKILNEYMNTKKLVKVIAKQYNLLYEDVVEILEEYKNRYGDIPRNLNNTYIDQELNEQIYELRKKGLTYVKVAEELERKGRKLDAVTVSSICKEVFLEKGEIEHQEINKQINEQIYELRKKGLTYAKIAKELQRQSIKIGAATVGRKCKAIFLEKGEKDPIADSKQRKLTAESRALYEEIYNLREQGLSFKKISYKLKENGKIISRQAVDRRHKKFLKINEQELARVILNLSITKKATMEQIQKIADYYGVDLEKTLNSLDER